MTTHTQESDKLNTRENRRCLIERRNVKLKERMNELYNKERLRYDDVISKLCEEFYLAPLTVQRIIKA